MSDLDAVLVPFGCCVMFLALGGGYIHLRWCHLERQARSSSRQLLPPRLVGQGTGQSPVTKAVLVRSETHSKPASA
jgi:hypothetical protein